MLAALVLLLLAGTQSFNALAVVLAAGWTLGYATPSDRWAGRWVPAAAAASFASGAALVALACL